MFDRDAAIEAWRARLAKTGRFFEADLDELEEHVRDHLDALAEVGLEGQAAFDIALESIGEDALLAGEFEKVNRALVWRGPLSWIATGVLAMLVGAPLLRTSVGALMRICERLGWGHRYHLTAAVAWPFVLGTTLGSFVLLLRWAERNDEPLAWARSAPRRVALLVLSSAFVIAALAGPQLLSNVGLWDDVNTLSRTWFDEARSLQVVGWGTPCALTAYLLGTRVAASRVTLGNASWLALGCLIAFAGNEILLVARYASFASAVAAGAGFKGMSTLTWLSTLVTPFVALACAFLWIHRRSPLPDELVRGRGFALAIVGACAAPIVGPLLWSPLAARAFESFGDGVALEGFRAEAQARVIATSMLIVLVGGWILRARHDARRAR
jgi:hypothetical protein